MSTIGVISDTHGLLRPEAVAALKGVDHIIHAGDVGDPAILPQLRAIAPVRAVRGNVDRGAWADSLPETDAFVLDGVSFYMLHDRDRLDIDPAAAGIDIVVFGHSHRPHHERLGDVVFLNPGSIGPRRFRLPIAMAMLTVDDNAPVVDMIELACD